MIDTTFIHNGLNYISKIFYCNSNKIYPDISKNTCKCSKCHFYGTHV